MINSINISPCTEPMHRDIFFHLKKILALATPGECSSVKWNCHNFICTINQKRSLPVITRPKKHLFLGMYRFCFLSEASWETVSHLFGLFLMFLSSFFLKYPGHSLGWGGGATPHQRCSQHILLPQPTVLS